MTQISCQHAGCDAFADTKVREHQQGRTIRWWYVCVVHLEEDFAPWLFLKRTRKK
jgi:hypothetical protein